MFCKWCGAPNAPDAKCCSACGKKLPPLDDCGGFSGLVPENRRKKRKDPPEKKPEAEEDSEAPEPSDPAESGGKVLRKL